MIRKRNDEIDKTISAINNDLDHNINLIELFSKLLDKFMLNSLPYLVFL